MPTLPVAPTFKYEDPPLKILKVPLLTIFQILEPLVNSIPEVVLNPSASIVILVLEVLVVPT